MLGPVVLGLLVLRPVVLGPVVLRGPVAQRGRACRTRSGRSGTCGPAGRACFAGSISASAHEGHLYLHVPP